MTRSPEIQSGLPVANGDQSSRRRKDVVAAAEPLSGPQRYLVSGPGPASFENADEYDQILNGVTDALEPRDFIEASFVKDMTDHYWEARRCKRVITTILNGSIREAIVRIIKMARYQAQFDFSSDDDALGSEANRIIETGIEKNKAFQADLRKLSLDVSAVTDAAYLDNVDEIERLQRLIANVEGRRLVTLREFDRYRASTSRSEQRSLTTVVSDGG